MTQAKVADDKAIIRCQDLHFRYPGAEHPTLSAVNLDVATGENFAIIGPNGGGKSTLLRLLLGLAKPQQGSISICGRAPEQARNLIGYVPQYATFDRHFPLTVEQAVLQGRLGLGRNFFNRADRDKVAEVLDQVGLARMARQSIGSLSGGQMQRALIARAMAVDPKILMLDEPTASVDPQAEEELLQLLSEQLSHLTRVVVTHDLGFVDQGVARVACVNGQLDMLAATELNTATLNRLYGGRSRLQDQAQPGESHDG